MVADKLTTEGEVNLAAAVGMVAGTPAAAVAPIFLNEGRAEPRVMMATMPMVLVITLAISKEMRPGLAVFAISMVAGEASTPALVLTMAMLVVAKVLAIGIGILITVSVIMVVLITVAGSLLVETVEGK